MAGNMQDNFDENGNPIRCSFCGKEQGQVRRLVKGPTNIFICDECVAACSEILEESLASDFMDAARNGKLPGFLNDHGQAASQPAVDPEAEGFELEDDRPVEDVSLLVIVPVLTAVSREHGMLDGENKGATGSEASAYLLANIRE